MEKHIEWYEKIKNACIRTYFPIPDMFHIDPVVKSYIKGGCEGHIYIVKTPDDENDGFKIGSTTQLVIRMYYYPIGTELLFCKKVNENIRDYEKKCIRALKSDKRFKLRRGREWFKGSYEEAIKIVLQILS